MKLLYVSYCLLMLLAVSHSLSQCHGVAACLSLSPMVAGRFSLSLQSHVVSACPSLSLLVAGCLSMSLECHRFCCISLTLSYHCWLSLILSLVIVTCLSLALPVLWSCFMSITVTHGFWLSLTFSPIAIELLHFSHCRL